HPDHPGGIYALVQKHKLPARMEVLDAIGTSRVGILQRVIEYEPVKIGGGQRLAFMMERPAGTALMANMRSVLKPYREDHLRLHLIKPIFETLKAMQERALFHGAISPLTLFAKTELSGLMLGECISLPAGFAQPAVMEPIERAQCEPTNKGDSKIEDDIFALGITTYLLATGKNPFAEMPPEDFMRARLEIGTTALLFNHAKLQPSMLEFIRGVCSDIPRERWNFSEIESWLGGNRVALRATAHTPKASRSIVLNGKEFFRARDLAAELGRKPGEIRKLVETKELLRWLHRSLDNYELHETVNELLEKTALTSVTDEMLAARIAIAIDPQGPIRYKGLQLMPLSIGTVLAKAFIDQNTGLQQVIAEIIASDLISYWIKQPGNGGSLLHTLSKEVDQAHGYITVSGLGYGLERAIYELQHHAPCYSELFARYYMLSLKQLLPALDELAADSRRPAEPLDRHAAGFLAARLGRSHESILKSLNPNKDMATRNITVLNLLSTVQIRYGIEPLPRLCAWMAETLKPALDRFHSRALKQTL
ncbi:MAG TPA: hypothetical protein PKW15_07770, partial [Alphaproteobacteria bacterium]|nr:hypothetical protein [Alphaproteobacteria bacterium]